MTDEEKAFYFELKYKDNLSGYDSISNFIYEHQENNFERGKDYKTIDQFILLCINKRFNKKYTNLHAFQNEFKKYHEYRRIYYSKNRKILFDQYEKTIEWFEKQDCKCGYCGITQVELRTIVDQKSDKNFTLNGGQKRSKGTLEIEQKIPKREVENPYDSWDNLILACPLCNNAKSNLIDEENWRNLFTEPMRQYYESLLDKKLTHPNPSKANK